MVCIDGYILTHGIEPVDMPEQAKVDRFLPEYQPVYKLDVDNPLTLGFLADPDYYMETRFAIEETHKEILKFLPQLFTEFSSAFGRNYDFIEKYRLDDAEKAIVAMGSVCGTIKDVVDDLRKKGKKVGLLKISCLRPFPAGEICAALKNISKVAVLDRALSLGSLAPLYSEIKAVFSGKKKAPKVISGFVSGIGGRDITRESIKQVFRQLNQREISGKFIDLKPELLQERL
jgi:pyruvate ferredoxin oxidoreductase alpha subunit